MMKKSRDYGKYNNMNLRIVIGLARNNISLDRSLKQLLSEYQLTVTQFSVLETLYHLGDQSICTVMNKTLATGGNMTVVVRNLERDKWIKRYQDPEDRRSSLIGLTEKGEKLIAEVFPKHLDNLSNELEKLNENEKEQLVFLLKKMSGLKP